MSNLKRQRCGRCHKDLTRGAFSPSKRGKSGKWCRACWRAYRLSKKGATKSTRKPAATAAVKAGLVVKHRPKKAIKARPVSKVLRKLESLAPPEVPALS